MYCGQCGKKVMENMLFCPFCGSPIVIPDQDAAPARAPEPEVKCVVPAEAAPAAPAAREEDRPVSLFADEAPAQEKEAAAQEEKALEDELFVPLSFDFEIQLAERVEPAPPADREEPAAPDLPLETLLELQEDMPSPEPRRPERRPEREARRVEAGSRRPASTYVPVRDVDPDNMFMDEVDGEDDYDLDEEPIRRPRSRYADDFDFEEPEHGSFLQRHIRGVVGLILLLVLMLICAVWAFSPKGQLALAKVNLAWTAEPYADLGYDAYRMDSDLLAARYYEKAFARDDDNYEYAHSAMVAYYEAEEIESAAAMLKKCVEMAPDNPEPYQEMLILYPDVETRPWEITELIRLGYQRTGHDALKLN